MSMKKCIHNPEIFTHFDRVLYPEQGITKKQLAEFYENISEWILPYIINRPLTLLRCPQGQQRKCFYQKNMTESFPEGVFGLSVKEKEETRKYIYIKNVAGLMALVQLGVLEIHPWGSTVNNIEKPDQVTFDLDPAPGVQWVKVIAAARDIRKQLEKLNLKSFVKTSGGKGLHIVLPIRKNYEWDKIKLFTHAFVEHMVNKNPQAYTGAISKSKRQGKIFIDYLRNVRGATTVAAYSTRARPGAPVSTPLHWDELTPRIQSTSYTVNNLLKRLTSLKDDPWVDFFTIKQTLPGLS